MIYIVRHGETDWNVIGRNQGRTDIELNENGIKQAEETAKKLEKKNFDMIFSSPLKRAYKTAQIICDDNIIFDERLIERCNGDLEGKLKSEYIGLVNFADSNENRHGIEPLPIFRKRITDFFDYILKNYPGKEILVVTHAGVCIYAKCYFEGEPKDGDYSKYKLKNCEVLEYKNDLEHNRFYNRKYQKSMEDDDGR